MKAHNPQMKYAPKHAMQTGGQLRSWSSPDRKFRQQLVKLDLECEADSYAGVLILTQSGHHTARTLAVQNARKELGAILAKEPDDTIVYWRMHQSPSELQRLMSGLTANPIYDDR
jgi:hypothetical protein